MSRLQLASIAVLAASMLTACSNGSSDDDSLDTPDGVSFNFSDAALLVANEDVIQGVEAQSQPYTQKSNEIEPLLYQVRSASPRTSIAGRASTEGGTNLFAVDDNGGARLAIDSDYPIEILYTAINPDADKAYVAIQIEEEDMRQLTFETGGCAFFEIDLATDEASCVAEGLNLQNLERGGHVEIATDSRGNIQFDDSGNVYFLAEAFELRGEPPHEYYDLHLYWNEFILYRYDGENTVAVSNDADNISRYVVMPTGELVIFSDNEITGNTELILIQGEQRILLAEENQMNFFTTDTYRSVMHVTDSKFGVHITRPAPQGGIHRTILDTEFIQRDSLSGVPTEVVLGDDGNVYGLFSGERDVEGQTDGEHFAEVYQLMPFLEVPKASIELGRENWRDQARRTRLLMSRGFLFYRERQDDFVHNGSSYGAYDSIVVMNLNTRQERRILVPETPDDGRFTLHRWQLSGDTLYFSALDNSRNSTVMGEIDVIGLSQADHDTPAEDFLSLRETATALGAATEVRQITVVRPLRPEGDIGGQPNVRFIQQKDNLNSVSMEFTKYMREETVQDALSFTDTATGDDVPFLPVWGYRSLHLVPDLNGFGRGEGQPLSPDTEYKLSISNSALDDFDWELANGSELHFLTRPRDGWYYAEVKESNAPKVYDNGTARYAGPGEDKELGIFKVARTPNEVTDFRFEFSGVNLSSDLAQIVFFDENHDPETTNLWDGWIGEFQLEPWVGLNYNNVGGELTNTNINHQGGSPHVANGVWQRYRIDVYANDFRLYQSYDGENFEFVLGTDSVRDRGNSGTGIYLLLKNAAHFDQLQLQELDGNGDPTGDLLLDEDFDDEETLPAYLEGDLEYWNVHGHTQ